MLRRTESRSVAVSCPATRAVPDVALASVQRILIVVVLPAPLGPRKPKVSPLVTSKSMPRTAWTSPYCLVRPETYITASGLRPFPPGSSPATGLLITGLPAPAPPASSAPFTASPPLLPPLRCRFLRLDVISAVLRAGSAVGGVLIIGGEDPVQGLARVRENLARLPRLSVPPGAQHPENGHPPLPRPLAHLDRGISHRAGHRAPRGAPRVVT